MDYVRRTSDDAERTQHLTTDILVDLDGDRAELTANMLVTFFPPGSDQLAPALRLVGLKSAFSALRTSEGWRLLRTDVTPLWQQLS
ncbi:nuclear transport factor 2 family protein [Actinoplanes sp. NEAU-A11]|uniref:Nuclear transport factor 2 family protein n=1 Tax=Actinoplanes aureus TaxID=2792083 RepID=A0A931G5Z7_9ACTN|nr:nuclear transport factor 2 family protein [Actinoplanes aureus]